MNEEIRRGDDADRLLSDPLFTEAFAAVETALVSEIKRVDVGASDRHRDLIVSLQLLAKVRGYIEQVAQTGRMAAITQEQEGWRDKIARRFR